MGGLGSGIRQLPRGKKTTVEEAVRISIKSFRGRINTDTLGTMTWKFSSENQSSVRYEISDETGMLAIVLKYRLSCGDDVRMLSELQTTPTQFGGERWWFTCPLISGRSPCQSRVGTLYLPPGERYFGCRKCHNLTYESCQWSHLMERMLARYQRNKQQSDECEWLSE